MDGKTEKERTVKEHRGTKENLALKLGKDLEEKGKRQISRKIMAKEGQPRGKPAPFLKKKAP